MKKNIIKKIAVQAALIICSLVLFTGITGCAASQDNFFNPFVLVNAIDQVDNTELFINTYDAFLGSGLNDNITTLMQLGDNTTLSGLP